MTYLNDIDLPDPPWIGNPDYWMEMLGYMDDIYEKEEDEDDDI